jgi:hypothetical protein
MASFNSNDNAIRYTRPSGYQANALPMNGAPLVPQVHE